MTAIIPPSVAAAVVAEVDGAGRVNLFFSTNANLTLALGLPVEALEVMLAVAANLCANNLVGEIRPEAEPMEGEVK